MLKELRRLVSPLFQSELDSSSVEDRLLSVKKIKELIVSEMKKIQQEHARRAGGTAVSRKISRVVDTVLTVICNGCRGWMKLNGNDEDIPNDEGLNIALAAVGGYGKGDLQPFSDIDLLFVYRGKLSDDEHSAISKIISLMWDLGFDVSHSTRTLSECIDFIKVDIPTRTAVIDLRFLWGNSEVFEEVRSAITKEITKNSVDNFIQMKTEELKNRHGQYNGTVNISEPNIKNGVGGLRDYHTALWASAARFGVSSLSGLRTRGILDGGECSRFSDAVDFLLRARNELHFLCKKREDTLYHELQEKVAENLGYAVGKEGVDNFMRDFYRKAREIYFFSNGVLHTCGSYKKFSRFTLLRLRKKRLEGGFERIGEQLFIRGYNPDIFIKNPILLLDVFVLCQRFALTVSEPLKRSISHARHLLTEDFVKTDRVSLKIRTILSGNGAGGILRQMHNTGILEKVLKEFSAITCYSPRDHYHRYTVDEHTLRSLEAVDELEKKDVTQVSDLFRSMQDKEVVRFALLFHDIGKKGEPGHAERGALVAERVMKRWGFESISKDVVFLVRNHLVMAHIAFRRDVEGKKVVEEFCEKVQNVIPLKRLYVLTYADLSSVAPSVWSEWKGALLRELFFRSYAFLESRELPSDKLLLAQKKEEIAALFPEKKDDIDDYFSIMPEKHILTLLPEVFPKYLSVTRELSESNAAIGVFVHEKFHHVEVLVCTHGQAGTLSRIAGALSINDINIMGAEIYTRKDGVAVDTIKVTPPALGHLPQALTSPLQIGELDDEFWLRVTKDIRAVLDEECVMQELFKKRISSKKLNPPQLGIKTKIWISNDTSDSHSLIEVITQDRFALLYHLTDFLYCQGLNIDIAKISTEGSTAIDVFYVTEVEGGGKIVDSGRLETIREGLAELFG